MYIVSIAKDTQAYLIVEKKMLHVNLLLQKAKKSETLKKPFHVSWHIHQTIYIAKMQFDNLIYTN